MTKRKKTGGRDFQKGHKPLGHRPKLSPEARAIRELTAEQYILMTNKLLSATEDEIIEISESPNSTMLEKFIAQIIVKGLWSGDAARLGFFLDRVIGPVIKKTDVTSGDKPLKSGTIIYLPYNGKDIKKG